MTNAYYFMIEKLIEKKPNTVIIFFSYFVSTFFCTFLVHDGVQTRAHHDAALFGLCFCQDFFHKKSGFTGPIRNVVSNGQSQTRWTISPSDSLSGKKCRRPRPALKFHGMPTQFGPFWPLIQSVRSLNLNQDSPGVDIMNSAWRQ